MAGSFAISNLRAYNAGELISFSASSMLSVFGLTPSADQSIYLKLLLVIFTLRWELYNTVCIATSSDPHDSLKNLATSGLLRK